MKSKVFATIGVYLVVRHNFKNSPKLTKQTNVMNPMERKVAVKTSLMVDAFSVTTISLRLFV